MKGGIIFSILILLSGLKCVEIKTESDLWTSSKSSTQVVPVAGKTITNVLEYNGEKVKMVNDGTKNYVQINGVDYPVNFSDLNNFFHISNTYYFCPKGVNQRLVVFEGSTFNEVPYDSNVENKIKNNEYQFELQCYYLKDVIYLNLIKSPLAYPYLVKQKQLSGNRILEKPNLISVEMNDEVKDNHIYVNCIYKEKRDGKNFYKYVTNKIDISGEQPSGGTIDQIDLLTLDEDFATSKMCYDKTTKKIYLVLFNEGSSSYKMYTTSEFETTQEGKRISITNSNDDAKIPINKDKGTYEILDFDFLNGCPMYYFKVKIGGETYWGEGDITKNQVIFLSKESISQLTTYQNSKNGVLITKTDGTSEFVCPMEFDSGKTSCNTCPNYLLLDPTDHNICSSSNSGADTNTLGTYAKCLDNYYATSTGCKDCTTGGKYKKYDTDQTTFTNACSCDSELYIIDETKYTCTSCKALNKLKDKDEDTCSTLDKKPDNSYWFNEKLQVFEKCHSTCETCTGALETECASCGGKLGLYTDNTDKSCVNCLDKSMYRTENDAVCITPANNNFFLVDDADSKSYGFIDYCHGNCATCRKKGTDSDNHCDTCISSLFQNLNEDDTLDYYNCVQTCDKTLASDTTAMKCINCATDNKYKYSDSTECIEKKEGVRVVDSKYGIIVDCHQLCSECTDASFTDADQQCTKCKTGKYLQDKNCVSSCDDNLYQDETERKCINCHASNKYKYYGSQFPCIDAPTDKKYHVKDDTHGIIFNCGDSCESCEEEPISGNDKCKTCPTGKVFDYEKNYCVEKNDCLPNYGLNDSKDQCINCSERTDKQYKYKDSLECIDKPGEGSYPVAGSEKYGLYGKCYSTCLTCTEGEETDAQTGTLLHHCTKCKENLKLTTTGNCVSSCNNDKEGIYNGDSQCHNCKSLTQDNANGMYKLDTDSFCIAFPSYPTYEIDKDYNLIGKCHEKCSSCSKGPTATELNCDKCLQDYVSSTGGNCVTECQENEGVVDGVCVNCQEKGLYKQEGTVECVNTQPGKGFYQEDSSHNFYKKCVSPCTACDGSGNACTECETGKFLELGKTTCTDSCPEELSGEDGKCVRCNDIGKVKYLGTGNTCIEKPTEGVVVIDKDNGIIKNCHSECSQCKTDEPTDQNHQCTQCKDNKFLYEGNCFANCDEKLYEDSTKRECINCKSKSPPQYKYIGKDSECRDLPTDKKYYEEDKTFGIIFDCGDSCESCEEKPSGDDDKCKTCPNGSVFDIDHKKCILQEKCLPDYGLSDDGKSCSNCKLRGDNKKYKYQESLICIEKPSEGTYDIPNKENFGLIGKCAQSCKTCSQGEETTTTGTLHHCIECSGNLQLTAEMNCISTCTNQKEGVYKSQCVNCATIKENGNTDGLYRTETDSTCSTKPSFPTYVIDGDYNILGKCDDDCSECSAGASGGNSNCSKCKTGLLSFTGGNCVTSCANDLIGILDGMCVNCATKGQFKQEGEDNCVTTEPGAGFYKKDDTYGYYQKCTGDCAECVDTSTKCTKCKTGLFLQYQSNTCSTGCPKELAQENGSCVNCHDKGQYKYIDDTTCKSLDDNTKDGSQPIFVSNENYGIIEKCSSSCASCKDSADHCTSCPSGKFLSNNRCIDGCPEFYGKNDATGQCEKCSLSGKYLDNINGVCISEPKKPYAVIKKSGNDVIIELCYETCKSCERAGDASTHQCSECDGTKYLQPNVKNCIENYCPTKYAKENNKCVNCHDQGKYIYANTETCVNGENGKPPIGTVVIDASSGLIEKCYDTCAECTAGSTSSTDQKCTSCRDGYKLDGSSCIEKCDKPKKFKIDLVSGQYKCLGDVTCPINQKLLVANTYQCVESCLSQSTCQECKNKKLYEYNGQCIEACPEGTKKDEQNQKCETVGETVKEENGCTTTKLNTSKNKELTLTSEVVNGEVSKQVKNYATVSKSEKNVNLISYSNVEIAVYENEKCGYDACMTYNLPYVNLTSCIETLRKEGVISKDEKVITGILSIERKNETTKQSGYYIGRENGEKIDTSKCKSSKIKVTYPLSDGVMELTKARELWAMGVDVNNPEDPFFNDFCFPYHDENGKDVILKDRREDYFKNNSLCEDGCDYYKVDFKTARVECNCEPQSDPFASVLENVPFIDFPDGLSMSNLIVVRCYNLVFDIEYIKKNAGFWILITLFILQIPGIIMFCYSGLQPLYTYLYQFTLENNEDKDKITELSEEQSKEQSKNESSYSKKSSINYSHNSSSVSSSQIQSQSSRNSQANPPKKKSSRNLETDTERETENNAYIKGTSPARLVSHERTNTTKLKMLDLYTKSDVPVTSSKDLHNNFIPGSSSSLKQKDDEKKAEGDFDPEELDDLAYEDAKEYDHRCFCVFYGRTLKKNMILISTFTNISVTEPFGLRIMAFILVVSAYFVFNGVFFDENYISNRYEESGSVDFLYVIKNEITKSILATIASMVIQFFVGLLLSSRKRFETLMKRELPKEEFMKKSNEIIKQMKCKIAGFFVIDIILMSFFWYYVSAFCAVYQKTQVAWIEGCLLTFVFCFVFYAVIYFIVTVFRYIGLKCGISCFYTISTYLT